MNNMFNSDFHKMLLNLFWLTLDDLVIKFGPLNSYHSCLLLVLCWTILHVVLDVRVKKNYWPPRKRSGI